MKQENSRKRILVTGGAGFVGTAFIRDALACGYFVRCLDLLVYGAKPIEGFINHPNFEFIRGDIRDIHILKRVLKNIDSVVHLAAIVGDLLCQAAPKSAVEINFKGTKSLAEEAKRSGIERFIFASTCSNYGAISSENGADEDHELNPLSLYAETKVDCERFLHGISDENFAVISLRFATGYGISFRMRFDLLVNSFAYEAWTGNKIVVFAANTWRPYIHVLDMSSAIRKILESPLEKVKGEIFNAGSSLQNYTKRNIVEILKKIKPQLKTKYIDSIDDRRDYKVNFDKLRQVVGFKPSRSVEGGFKELLSAFKAGLLTGDDFETNKLETLEKLFGKKENLLQRKVRQSKLKTLTWAI